MPRALGLARSDLRRLERLARQAGTTPARILKAVLRDGFEYTEWFVRRVKEGEAEPFALAAKSAKPLDPSIRSLATSRAPRRSARWKLLIHAPVELDA